MTAPRNLPSPRDVVDPEYAWAVGDIWLTDGADELDAERAPARPHGGG